MLIFLEYIFQYFNEIRLHEILDCWTFLSFFEVTSDNDWALPVFLTTLGPYVLGYELSLLKSFGYMISILRIKSNITLKQVNFSENKWNVFHCQLRLGSERFSIISFGSLLWGDERLRHGGTRCVRHSSPRRSPFHRNNDRDSRFTR